MKVTLTQLKSFNNEILSAIITVAKISLDDWTKLGMARAIAARADEELVQRAVEIVVNGLDEARVPKKARSTKGGIEQAIMDVIIERLDEIEAKMQPKIIDRVITIRDTVEFTAPEGEVYPEEFDHILRLASQRVNTLLIGPTGCGKTYLAGKIAEHLGLRFASVSVTLGMSKSDIMGYLLPTGKGGAFEYVYSLFVDMYENGGVFLIDEMDNGDPNILGQFNQALANGEFYLPQRKEKHRVVRHEDFVCVAAANTYGTGADAIYVGRNQLDGATLDRFATGQVELEYSEKVEESLVHKDVFEWGKAVRKGIAELKLLRNMSTRTMIDMTKMRLAYDYGPEDFSNMLFTGWSADEIRRMDPYVKKFTPSENAGEFIPGWTDDTKEVPF